MRFHEAQAARLRGTCLQTRLRCLGATSPYVPKRLAVVVTAQCLPQAVGDQIITNSSDRYLLHRVSTSDPLLLLLPRDLLHLTLHIGQPSPLISGDIIGIRCNTTCAISQELVLTLALVLVVNEI